MSGGNNGVVCLPSASASSSHLAMGPKCILMCMWLCFMRNNEFERYKYIIVCDQQKKSISTRRSLSVRSQNCATDEDLCGRNICSPVPQASLKIICICTAVWASTTSYTMLCEYIYVYHYAACAHVHPTTQVSLHWWMVVCSCMA